MEEKVTKRERGERDSHKAQKRGKTKGGQSGLDKNLRRVWGVRRRGKGQRMEVVENKNLRGTQNGRIKSGTAYRDKLKKSFGRAEQKRTQTDIEKKIAPTKLGGESIGNRQRREVQKEKIRNFKVSGGPKPPVEKIGNFEQALVGIGRKTSKNGRMSAHITHARGDGGMY